MIENGCLFFFIIKGLRDIRGIKGYFTDCPHVKGELKSFLIGVKKGFNF